MSAAAVSSRLVQVWNARTAIDVELQDRQPTPEPRAYLTERRAVLCAQQDRLEAELTRLAARSKAAA